MYFDSFEALLQMDGHGGFVWAAYGITTTVIVLLLLPRRRQRQTLQRLQGELRRQQSSPTAEEVS